MPAAERTPATTVSLRATGGAGAGIRARPSPSARDRAEDHRAVDHPPAGAGGNAWPGDPRHVTFTLAPCTVLGLAAVAGAVWGSDWSRQVAALPWIVAIVVVGLPHGAADLALARRAWRGRGLVLPGALYLASMAAVAACYAWRPTRVLAGFALLAGWHFGLAHAESDGVHPPRWSERFIAATWRGALVVAVPLVAWPEETAGLVGDLLALTHGASAGGVPATTVRAIGVGLAVVIPVALAAEGRTVAAAADHIVRWLWCVCESVVIGSLGWFTDPLFSVGLYFLAWHGWRQLDAIGAALAGGRDASWAGALRRVVIVHRRSLPLLLPAWCALGAAWWAWSPEHSGKDLALLSIAAYVIATPAHEVLDALVGRALRSPERAARPDGR